MAVTGCGAVHLRPRLWHSLLLLILLCGLVVGDTGLHAGDDLFRFVTRPDLMPPKWHVKYYDRAHVAPGYWFLTTFNMNGHHIAEVMWQPCQFGPLIYDADGELIWSGSCDFDNRLFYNFWPTTYNGVPALQGIMEHSKIPDKDVGAVVFLAQNYTVIKALTTSIKQKETNIHELNVMRSGKSALITTRRGGLWPLTAFGMEGDIWLARNGFREIDINTGDTIFDWSCEDHIGLDESTFNTTEPGDRPDPSEYAEDYVWDAFHINSADKNADGDYLISMRHTDSFMLVSGKDGHIIWRCGGRKNDFSFEQNFTFSRQHNPRFISHTKDRSVISFLDNGLGSINIDPQPATGDFSRGLVLELDHKAGQQFKGRILRQYIRPDLSHSRERGSMQILPNKNVFMAWTGAGFFSEHAQNGRVLLEAQFYNEHRLHSYRSHKFNWVGMPAEPPDVKAFGYTTGTKHTTAVYVSWNGATEHSTWNFYSDGKYIGSTNRTGFETVFAADGPTGMIVAEALDRDGRKLGRSLEVRTLYPRKSGMQPQVGVLERISETRVWKFAHLGISMVGCFVLGRFIMRRWTPSRGAAGWGLGLGWNIWGAKKQVRYQAIPQ